MSARNSFSDQLLHWHRQHGRHNLPWQSQPADPYRVWLSEIMLQQTQVTTVIPYFERFLRQFPTLQALANAQEQSVLALWSGLGYYARARNLLACARMLVDRHGGQFPATAAELARLPGIGPSTAAAIASTVFCERAAILDGNVKRVLARLTCASQPWGSPALARALLSQAQALLPDRAKDMPAYTQAIMDLGATICLARSPQCGRCPVSAHCNAYARGTAAHYPVPAPKRSLKNLPIYWCVVLNDKGVWLQQQAVSGLWGGLWTPWPIDPNRLPARWEEMSACAREVIELTHLLTHRRLQISVGVFERDRLPPGAPAGLKHFSWDQVVSLPLPSPVQQLLKKLMPAAKSARAGKASKR